MKVLQWLLAMVAANKFTSIEQENDIKLIAISRKVVKFSIESRDFEARFECKFIAFTVYR